MMKQTFWHSVWTSLALLGSLIALDLLSGSASVAEAKGGWFSVVLATIQSRELNREGKDQQTAGYYEGLLNEGSRVSSMNSLLLSGATSASPPRMRLRGVNRRKRLADRYEHRGDFLYYEARPNVNVADYEDTSLRLVTNSRGLADREYSLEKPPNTRRIALFGDSISRGMGAPFGTSYEALFEKYLNEAHASPAARFEVLNFSVSGYRVTQMFDVAMHKAPTFTPDVYVFALTEMIGTSRWGEHFAQLLMEGIDLKYDFLEEAAARVNLRSTDAPGTVAAKLAPVRLPILRQILSRVRDQAARDGASVVVLLVPNVRPAAAMEEDFEGIRPLLNELRIPYVDLSDTFDAVPDLTQFRVSGDNIHPNERGQYRIFERLRDRVMADPALAWLFVGR
jgi:lysophospholipase L1-like esterase